MFKTEKELFSQYEALQKTYEYMSGSSDSIKNFFEKASFKSLTFIGCGSSYSLCKSAASSIAFRTGLKTNVIAAGDLMINFPFYRELVKDTLLFAPTRSGSTSEVIKAVKMAKQEAGALCISVCTKENSELSGLADFNIILPWALDDSVCQTRTVTNLYFANLFLAGLIAGDKILIDELKSTVENGNKYIKKYTGTLKAISDSRTWNKVVVLADAELEGIAEEGALAFKEICQLQSNYYHILDVRHGPAVLIDNKTLVIVACTPFEDSYQKALIMDQKAKGALIVTVSSKEENIWGGDHNITVPAYNNYSAVGVPFIFVPQALAFFKALATGVNPDEPNGLHPWIKL